MEIRSPGLYDMLLFKKRKFRKRKSKESEVSIFRSNGAGCTKCMCTEIKPDRYRLYELPLLFFLIRPYRCAHYKGHRFYLYDRNKKANISICTIEIYVIRIVANVFYLCDRDIIHVYLNVSDPLAVIV